MERVQKALRKQLIAQDERLTLELRQKTNELETLKERREALGVDLYGFQQALAKLQMALEKKHDELALTVQSKAQNEEEVSKLEAKLAEKLKTKARVVEQRNKTQAELDKVKLMIQQTDEVNRNLGSDILVTRRAAYGTEESMQRLEIEKSKQDERIAQLQEQSKRLLNEIAIVQAQRDAQHEECEAARRTVQEATAELEAIIKTKKEYMLRWRTGLANVAQRESALKAINESIESTDEKIRLQEISVRALEARIREQREQNDRIAALLARNEAEFKTLDAVSEQTAVKQRALQDRLRMLREDLENTDAMLQSILKAQKELSMRNDELEKNHTKLTQELQKLDDMLLETLSKQNTLEKGASSVYKAMLQLKREIQAKEAKMGEIQNEVARIKVDALNTEAHNQELTQILKSYDAELKEKDRLIEKYEVEIRQRHDKIDKKQVYIARLNKKLEQLLSNKRDEHTGPLEATIHNMQKEISQLNRENAEKEKLWIRAQTKLVSLTQETAEEHEHIKDLDSRQTVLRQKQLRARAQFESENAEIKDLKRLIRKLHNAMRKLNELINAACVKEAQLGNNIYCSEGEFATKLKELELECTQMDGNIARVKAEKEELLNQIVEIEKQILLWERKIQLEKETQEAIDPEYGKAEIAGMKKEIHRMELRLNQLQREQERMIVEMEKAIGKREVIQLASLNNLLGKGSDPNRPTQAAVRKALSQLKASLEQTIREARAIEQEIVNQENQSQILLDELQRQQQIYSQAEDARNALREALDDAFFVKQVNFEHIMVAQRKAKLYEDAANNRLRVGVPKEKLTEELDRQQQMYDNVRVLLTKLMQEFPKYEQWFKRLLDLKS